jgi:hypothetical protein
MTKKFFFIAALALVRVCPGQTPSSTPAQSSWQLGPPFEVESSRASPSPSVSRSPAPASKAAAPVVQTTPPPATAPESTPAQTTSELNSSSQMPTVDGPVWVITFVKTKSGLSDEYLKSITASLKPIYEEEKKQKILLDYKILSGDAGGERDFNFIIMVEYPNRAALDGLREKTEPIIDKIIGPAGKRRDMAAKRLDIREILATKTMREITLK